MQQILWISQRISSYYFTNALFTSVCIHSFLVSIYAYITVIRACVHTKYRQAHSARSAWLERTHPNWTWFAHYLPLKACQHLHIHPNIHAHTLTIIHAIVSLRYPCLTFLCHMPHSASVLRLARQMQNANIFCKLCHLRTKSCKC